VTKASRHGLAFRSAVVLDGDALRSPISDSYAELMHGAYRLLTLGGRYYRPIGEAPRETSDGTHSNVNETIDGSVFERWNKVPTYRPKNLADWAKRHSVNIETLNKSVRADDPKTSAAD
jgi:hypothetical protein